MSPATGPKDLNALKREVRNIWNQNAAFWDEYMGEGGSFQRLLIGPATERLLDLHPGELVLDVACGNGAFSRRMATLGAEVVAIDVSEVFLERARARTVEHTDRIEYKLVDATDRDQLLALGEERFDAAVCTMALMDMPAVDPLVSALSQLLKQGGRFVFSVPHPCFNNTSGVRMVAEEEDREGEIIRSYSLKVSKYIQPTRYKGLGVIGQPVPQYYFHRPLSVLFNTCFRAGFALDGLEEPVFSQEMEPTRLFGWSNYKEIPPVLVASMRLLTRARAHE